MQIFLLGLPTLFLTNLAGAAQGSEGKPSETWVWQVNPRDSSSSAANRNKKLLVLHQYSGKQNYFWVPSPFNARGNYYTLAETCVIKFDPCQENLHIKAKNPQKHSDLRPEHVTIFEWWHYFFFPQILVMLSHFVPTQRMIKYVFLWATFNCYCISARKLSVVELRDFHPPCHVLQIVNAYL